MAGETQRQLKYARMIQKDMADIFMKEGSRLLLGKFVTISHVKITSDLSIASVYLSFLIEADKEAVMQEIKLNEYVLKNALSSRIGKQVRKMPELQYFVDNLMEESSKINDLFDGLDIPSSDKNYKDDVYRADVDNE